MGKRGGGGISQRGGVSVWRMRMHWCMRSWSWPVRRCLLYADKLNCNLAKMRVIVIIVDPL